MESSYFRFLNEQLYNQRSSELDLSSLKMEEYHKGFAKQARLWNMNPLQLIYKLLNSIFSGKVVELADIGAGEGLLASTLHYYKTKNKSITGLLKGKPTFKGKIHSFDLYPVNDMVKQANASHVPLADKSVHCAIFCLSLMGTDYYLFLIEANRIVKLNGFIMIAEVQSRLVESKSKFTDACKSLGWSLVKQIDEDYFCLFLFQKIKLDSKSTRFPPLLPCLYKKR